MFSTSHSLLKAGTLYAVDERERAYVRAFPCGKGRKTQQTGMYFSFREPLIPESP